MTTTTTTTTTTTIPPPPTNWVENTSFQTISFGVPSTIDPDDGSQRGIVGTITFANKAAIIWCGWGTFGPSNQQQQQDDSIKQIGTGRPSMGPMVVAMPRYRFQGKDEEVSCSQLVGGGNDEQDEDQMIGWQMASRLTKEFNCPIIVSCSFVPLGEANENSIKAAALAEREIKKHLKEWKERSNQGNR